MSTKTWQDKLDPNGTRFKNPESAAWMEGFSDARMAVVEATCLYDEGSDLHKGWHTCFSVVKGLLGIEEEG